MLSKTQDRLPGFDIAITSDVPMGCGLSSSAALAVTVAELLDALLQTHLSPIEKAQICRAAEHEFAGVPCGLMDQLCVAACEEDQCMLIDFHANAYRFVPLDDSECVVMIADSKIKRGLAGSEYALRAEQCFAAAAALGVRSLRQAEESLLEQRSASLDAVHQRRVRHVIREIARVREAADCLERKDWPAFGKLMNDSHVSLRDDFEVSCAELNTLVEIAQSLEGVLGSRMTGGGFGGCTVSLVRKNFAGPVREQMSAEYLRRTGISPAVFTTPACAGVQVLQRPDSAS
jgi:galactokinase